MRALTLADVRTLSAPVPCRGALGLWRLPAEAEARVASYLRSTHARV